MHSKCINRMFCSSIRTFFSTNSSIPRKLSCQQFSLYDNLRLMKQVSRSNISSRLFSNFSRNDAQSSAYEMKTADYLDKLNGTMETVRQDLLQDDSSFSDVMQWCSKVFDYNVPHGKKIRGMIVLRAFHALAGNEASPADWKQACMLGWCVEMLQAYFLVCDDIMDQSKMRRGQPCWYKMPDVGLCAINDSLMLNSGIYKILRRHFQSSNSYVHLLEEFLQVSEKTINGQCLDMLSTPSGSRPRFDIFSMERYSAIVEYKTSHYTFCLPVHLAMHFVGRSSREDFLLTRAICLKLGLLFQIQDDFLDCFGEKEVVGKVGNDIEEGKCTWLAATFLQHAPQEMREEMMENYGVDNKEAVWKVKSLYVALAMDSKFRECQKGLQSDISLLIGELRDGKLKTVFYDLFDMIHKREK